MKKVYTLVLVILFSTIVSGQTITLVANQDNTLYESPTGSLSNGIGEFLFAGQTNNGDLRRGVVRFDLSSIPNGAIITSCTLNLFVNKTKTVPTVVSVHQLTKSWGEGTSDAPGQEGAGTASTPNDATWIHNMFNTSTWTTAGGDFIATVSAIDTINGTGVAAWSNANLLAEVQNWQSNPATNFGWILIGDESVNGTAVRFNSRENVTFLPSLRIHYSMPTIAISLNTTNVSCNGGADGSISASASGGTAPYTFNWSNSGITPTISNLVAGNYSVTVTDNNSVSSTANIIVTEPTAIVVNLNSSNPTCSSCNDGNIASSVSGGTPPYTYSWSNLSIADSISSLGVGSYKLTVSDANGCSIVDSTNLSFTSNSVVNLVITEIMFNPPESGTDSLEFIELVNAGINSVNLNGYSFSQGVNYTFPSVSIPAGQYFVVAVDSAAFRNVFGINADFIWNSGGLSNGGEDITLIDDQGRTIDSVDYENNNPWPGGTGVGGSAGGGASISLCDSTSDNNIGSNWINTFISTGAIVNGKTVYASPKNSNTCTQAFNVNITVNSNVSCNGGNDGSLTATASGGVAPYSFLWSNGSAIATNSNLVAASYTVTVSDFNGITATATVVVNQPAAILMSFGTNNPTCSSCSDGNIKVTISGGTPPYNYNWKGGQTLDSISQLTTGTYYLTVIDANGCQGIDSANLFVISGNPANLIITEIMYNPPESGTDSLEYIEIYNLENNAVSLNGYSFDDGVNYSFTTASIASHSNIILAKDSAAFRNVYGINADYIWASGSLSNGGEDIVLVDNFNRTVDSVDYENSNPWPSGTAAGGPNGGGASIFLIDSLLDNNDGANWVTSTFASGVTVNGFVVLGTPGFSSFLVGTQEYSEYENYIWYPNPARDNLTVKLSKLNKANLKITDLNGRLLMDKTIIGEKNTIKIQELPTGMYILQLNSKAFKLIVE